MEYVWIAALVLFVVIEAATVSLVSIWFAVGSLTALVTAFAGGQVWLQVVVFVVVSGLVLGLLRPAARKYLNVKKRPTNADRALGELCQVTERIDNVAGTGSVFVEGKSWSARSKDGRPIEAGILVRTVAIQGVKLIVETTEAEE